MLNETESMHNTLQSLAAADVSSQGYEEISSISRALQNQINLGFKRRDASCVKMAFDKHHDYGQSASISKSRLPSSCQSSGWILISNEPTISLTNLTPTAVKGSAW